MKDIENFDVISKCRREENIPYCNPPPPCGVNVLREYIN